MNAERFKTLPNILKLIIPAVSVLCMLSLALAYYQPSGTGLIWFTALASLICGLIVVVLFALEIEELLVHKKYFTWPLVECFLSLLFSILFFICIWLCVNGSEYGSTTAFTAAGFFCLTNFILYAFDFVLFLRIHLSLTHLYEVSIRESALNTSTYGGPSMTNLIRHPMFIRIASMLLSLTLLMCLSAAVPVSGVGASVFIALSSLIVASLSLAVTIGNLQENFARFSLFVYLAGGNEEVVSWRNLEYSVSLCLSSTNFVGFVLNWGLALSIPHGTPYGAAAFFSLMLSIMYLAGAIIALNIDEAEEAETARLTAYENL